MAKKKLGTSAAEKAIKTMIANQKGKVPKIIPAQEIIAKKALRDFNKAAKYS